MEKAQTQNRARHREIAARAAAPASSTARDGLMKAQCRPEQLGCCCGPRCLIKPLKRWAYARGRSFTDTFCRAYLRKYVKKWLMKWRKSLVADGSANGSSLDFPVERHGPIVDKLVAELPFKATHAPNEQLIGAIASALLDGNSIGEDGSVLEEQRQALEMAHHLAVYAVGLKVAIASNIGLSHSKVREYWFNRGPRMLGTMLFFCAFTVAVQEVMHSAEVAEGSISSERSAFDRLYTVVIASMALIISTFMLYFRLPDSIEASIARTAHDYYRAKKTGIRAVQEALVVPVMAGSENVIEIVVQSDVDGGDGGRG